MNCKTCRDERIIWTKDKYNRAVAVNCPSCNKNGIAVRKETEEMKNERINRTSRAMGERQRLG